jgi:hypothetical protein
VFKLADHPLVKIAGGIIIVDGVASIAYSQDQRPVSTLGRITRTIIGIGLLIFG